MELRIAVTSDLHFTGSKITNLRVDKLNNLDLFRSLRPDLIIVAGDLTDNGYDGTWYPFKTKNQWGGYRKWHEEASKNCRVLTIHGNHDTYVKKPYWSQPVRLAIILKYGYTFYSRTYRNFKILALGCQPMDSKKSVHDFLRKVGDRKIIIFFHYNLIGPYSEFWSDSDKMAFWNMIKPHHSNILCIIHGHIHANLDYFWEPETGYQVQCFGVGGPGLGLITATPQSASITFHS